MRNIWAALRNARSLSFAAGLEANILTVETPSHPNHEIGQLMVGIAFLCQSLGGP